MRRKVAEQLTFEAQLAAVAINLIEDMRQCPHCQRKGSMPHQPGFNDFREAFAPEMARIVIQIKASEHRWLERELAAIRGNA